MRRFCFIEARSCAIVLALLSPVSLLAEVDPPAARSGVSIAWRIGADISSLPEVEAGGGVFKDEGRPTDLLTILKSHGVTHARLRLWNHPKDGVCNLDQTVAMAQRLKLAGIPLLQDLHYSDTWADPGNQSKPAAWSGLHGAGSGKSGV